MNTFSADQKLAQALWKIYRRPDRPTAWDPTADPDSNLPWNDPDFSERMLREHLDQAHGAASRVDQERQLQLDWMWDKLGLQAGAQVLDLTCGPGLYAVALAERGCRVTGVDFGPASLAYARDLAKTRGVQAACTFVEQDVRRFSYPREQFEAALFIYGQLTVFEPAQTQTLLAQIATALKPGGRLVVELLNQERVDKEDSNWWYTGQSGLWGDRPFLHLGERFWDSEGQRSLERFQILQLETGQLSEILLCDQTYAPQTMTGMMKRAGFAEVEVYFDWAGLPLYDASEWVVYLARK